MCSMFCDPSRQENWEAGVQVLYQRCAAIDVGKDVIAVAVRLPGPDGRQTIKRTCKTFYGVLAEAAAWLSSLGVTHVAMEATGDLLAPYRLVDGEDVTVEPAAEFLRRVDGVRAARDNAAVVWDGSAALVPVLVGGRGALG
jgi:hypothetical protein